MKNTFIRILFLIALWVPLTLPGTEAFGRIEPTFGAVQIKVRSDRTVTEVFVTEGETVSSGQLLLQLENKREQAERDITAAKLDVARAELQCAEETFLRKTELFRRELIAEAQVIDARHKKECAAARYLVAQKELALAELKLEELCVTAPIEGKVYHLPARVGSSIASGQHLLVGEPHLSVRLWAKPEHRTQIEQQALQLFIEKSDKALRTQQVIYSSHSTMEAPSDTPYGEDGEVYQEFILQLDDDCTLPIGSPVRGTLTDS